jgi:hypothetical protein
VRRHNLRSFDRRKREDPATILIETERIASGLVGLFDGGWNSGRWTNAGYVSSPRGHRFAIAAYDVDSGRNLARLLAAADGQRSPFPWDRSRDSWAERFWE